jgi:hypothetical protein
MKELEEFNMLLPMAGVIMLLIIAILLGIFASAIYYTAVKRHSFFKIIKITAGALLAIAIPILLMMILGFLRSFF